MTPRPRCRRAALAAVLLLGACEPPPAEIDEEAMRRKADLPKTTVRRARITWNADRVIDCHVHFGRFRRLGHFLDIRRYVGVDRMNIVCILGPDTGVGNCRALYAKAVGGGRFYCFGGLNHATFRSKGKVVAPPFAEQVDHLTAAGFDGVKLIESKPSVRRDWYPFAPDGDYYRGFWARCEQRDVPVLWHVADPASFWTKGSSNPDWTYRKNAVAKEKLHDEVERVLSRHRKLRVVLAHFYFISADLPRCRRFFERHPNAHFDLALGDEWLFNLSDDPAAARKFLIEHADRIFYGTDISDRNALAFAAGKAQAIRRFLETDDVFTIPGRRAPDGRTTIRGVKLPKRALAKIYAGNFEKLAGRKPRPVDLDKAIEFCTRSAELTAKLTGRLPSRAEPGKVRAALRRLKR